MSIYPVWWIEVNINSILQDIFVFFWHENFHRFCKALAEASSERWNLGVMFSKLFSMWIAYFQALPMGGTSPYNKRFTTHKQNISPSNNKLSVINVTTLNYRRVYWNKQFQFGNCKIGTIPVWFRLVRVRDMKTNNMICWSNERHFEQILGI